MTCTCDRPNYISWTSPLTGANHCICTDSIVSIVVSEAYDLEPGTYELCVRLKNTDEIRIATGTKDTMLERSDQLIDILGWHYIANLTDY